MITEDYVSFETAKLLREKGFDGDCQYCYIDEDDSDMEQLEVPTGYDAEIDAPTLQMAMKWLRETYKIHITIYPYGNYSCDNYQFDVYENSILKVSKDDGYMTCEKASEAGIKYCLENLI